MAKAHHLHMAKASLEADTTEEHGASDSIPNQDDEDRLQDKTEHNMLCEV